MLDIIKTKKAKVQQKQMMQNQHYIFLLGIFANFTLLSI